MLAELVLRHKEVWRTFGEWESAFLAQRLKAVRIDRPVFIAGLARAGTTILLRKLSELPDFASHRYSDFPFLFTPYAWARVREWAPGRAQKPRERMHKDGIFVTAESPEAMEEVLWSAFFPHLHDPAYINVFEASHAYPEFESFLADHIRKLILTRGTKRYLSKNNYNITRLKYLAQIFPDSRFVIPVRDPLMHVASLVKQHELFCTLQRRSSSVRKRLGLLAHFEFGLDRQPINVGDDDGVAAIQNCWRTGDEVRGWAKYWAKLYGHIWEMLTTDCQLAERCLVVRYEDLCDLAIETMTTVCKHLDLFDVPIQLLAADLHRPTYYTPRFTADERSIIFEETAEVARSFRYK